MQAAHVRTWLNTIAKTCQCCTQRKDQRRAERAHARCCAKGTCCESTLSRGTQRYLLRLLRAALQDAVEEDRISRNVARLVKLPAGGQRKVRPWSAEEARRFLRAAQTHRLYALWAVALAVGLRRGEALGLRWDNIDLTTGHAEIRQALHRVDGALRLEEVKTEASDARIPIPRPLLDVLRQHRARQAGERLRAGAAWR